MERLHITSASPFEKSIGFSRAVRVGSLIVVSGTAPIGSDGKAAFPGDLYNQTKHCIEIIKKAIEDAGGTLKDVVRTRMYLTDTREWEQAGKAHGEYFKDIRPASTMVEVKGLLDPEWLIEMEAECIIA